MMDILTLLTGGGVLEVFQIGFLPTEEDFMELSASQYDSYFRKIGYTDEKLFTLLPQDPQKQGYDDFEGLNVCTEGEKNLLLCGVAMIEKHCKDSKKVFDSDFEKLKYTARTFPDVFSKGTKFEKYRKYQADLKVVSSD